MNTYVISAEDHDRITEFLKTYRPFIAAEFEQILLLREKLRNAVIVPESRLSRSIVSMYATAKITNLIYRDAKVHMLVYPHHAHPGRRKLSLLSPLGTVLLGSREGDIIECAAGEEILKFAVNEVLLQPRLVAGQDI